MPTGDQPGDLAALRFANVNQRGWFAPSPM